VIQYIVAEDRQATREAMHLFLQNKIETEFGPALGTTCAEVGETLNAVKQIGSALRLLVLDMDFDGDILGGGLRILGELSPQQRGISVVYSSYVNKKKMHTNRMLGDEIASSYGVPTDRIIDKIQGSAALWAACASVLSQTGNA
jgi:hypothetical protein